MKDAILEEEMRVAEMREIVREEIASLAGLAQRRLQLAPRFNKNPHAELLEFWGEVLRDYGETPDEPGPSPPASATRIVRGPGADDGEAA